MPCEYGVGGDLGDSWACNAEILESRAREGGQEKGSQKSEAPQGKKQLIKTWLKASESSYF